MKKISVPGFRAMASLLVILPALSCSLWPSETERSHPQPSKSNETQFLRIIAAYDSMHYASAVQEAKLLIEDAPSHPKLDHAFIIAARSSQALDRFEAAALFARRIQERYPVSAFVTEAQLIGAECHLQGGRYYDSIELATTVLLASDSTAFRQRAGAIQDAARAHLSPGELEALLEKHPSAPIAEELALDVARREFASGNYERTYALLADLLYRFPQHHRASEMRRLLKAASARRTAHASQQEPVDPYKIGLFYPITGKFSLYGRYFEQGVTLAVEDYNQNASHPVTLVSADTKASPVAAARAVRKLIHEDGVLAVVGGVLALPTVTAAVEANAWGVPLLSPVVTDDELSEVGQWIFQTTVSGEIEVTAMANCAIDQLLARRFAILSPNAGEERHLAEFFRQEITTLGGTVVAMQFFEPRSTDFKEQLEAIIESAPEALFIPADSEELINILPQIRFYDLHARLLGLSNWNADKLIRLSHLEIEGALFPLETYHGKDAAAYEGFLVQHRAKIGEEVSPFTVAGYFGARLILKAIAEGMSDREEVREFLSGLLYGNADRRRGEAAMLTILTVHDGTVTEFSPAVRSSE
jgi:branched-chain amino acid transport system substrate-binding protein